MSGKAVRVRSSALSESACIDIAGGSVPEEPLKVRSRIPIELRAEIWLCHEDLNDSCYGLTNVMEAWRWPSVWVGFLVNGAEDMSPSAL
jgi:hypothetical protein